MKIIISPAKKMNVNTNDIPSVSTPIFLHKSEAILTSLLNMSNEQLKDLWKCNDKIALENIGRVRSMDLNQGLTPALLAYDGIQYKYMAPTIFEDKMLAYVSEHLRILSGFYGILRPLDGVSPYRLEMQAPLSINSNKSLYDFWGSNLYQDVANDGVILNLASKEYSKCIEKYLQESDLMVTCIFGELVNEKLVQKATYAKMARGEMVRFLAENNISDLDGVKEFQELGFSFDCDRSDDRTFVFLRL